MVFVLSVRINDVKFLLCLISPLSHVKIVYLC